MSSQGDCFLSVLVEDVGVDLESRSQTHALRHYFRGIIRLEELADRLGISLDVLEGAEADANLWDMNGQKGMADDPIFCVEDVYAACRSGQFERE